MGLPLPVILILLSFSDIALGLNYHIDKTCLPLCTPTSDPPNAGGAPCLCNPDAVIPGCTIAPCGPGDDSSTTYTCQCTEYFQPPFCVTLKCDNGTTAIPSYCPSHNYKGSSYYPSSNYPSSSYPSNSYPASSYPAISYPSSGYPSSSYRSGGYPSYYPSPSYSPPSYTPPSYTPPSYTPPSYTPPSYQPQSYPSPSYQSYTYATPSYSPSHYLCKNYCGCEPYLPADCTEESVAPIVGGEPCACNPNGWRTGCTLKPCQEGDTGEDDYVCECTPTHSPDFCRMPRCTED